MSKENYSAHQEVKSQAHMGSSTESKVVLETTRTTSATMRMEHKANFPDLPVTFSQRTQTPTIPLVSEGTMVGTDLKRETKSQTESTQTQFESTKPSTTSVPFPFNDTPAAVTSQSALNFFESNLKNLPPLQEEKYTRYEDLVKSSKTYVHKQNEVKDQFKSKLTEDLSYLNLVPEPPPEMGFMPKVQAAQPPERIVEKVKKLEEVHQSNETPLSGTAHAQQSFKKEERHERKEFLSTKTVGTSPFMQKPASPGSPRPYTPQFKRDQLFTAEPRMTRSPSPKPSTEAVNMEKLWTMKAKSPEPFSHNQQQSFSHEQKSSFVAYSSSQTQIHEALKQEILQSKEHFVPIQAYGAQTPVQEETPRPSIKDTKSFFEQRIKQEEVKLVPDLKAPGLVRQFAKPMIPLIPLDIEPGSPPEICYAPKPVYERKQSYVEKIEKSLERDLDKEPERVPRGGVRILPQRQTPQRSLSPPKASQPQKPFVPQQAPAPALPPVVKPFMQQPAPSPTPVVKPFVSQPAPPVIKPDPVVLPVKLPEPFVPQVQQYESREFKSENFELKRESSTGYRHVEPPKFPQQEKSTEPAPLPPIQFEVPKLEPFVPFSEPFKTQQPASYKPLPPTSFMPQQPPREVPIAIQKPEPAKPNLQQHKPVSSTQPKPFVQVKPKFNELFTETQNSHSMYKNFVKSEESTHTSESYFQKIEKSSQHPFLKQEPPKQQFNPPPPQVRKKHLPDVML